MSNVEKWPQRHLLCLGSERYVFLSPRSCQLFLVRCDASHVQRHSDVFQVGMLILHCRPDVFGHRDIDIATATEIPYADAIGKPARAFALKESGVPTQGLLNGRPFTKFAC
jgi:hypothetical protein